MRVTTDEIEEILTHDGCIDSLPSSKAISPYCPTSSLTSRGAMASSTSPNLCRESQLNVVAAGSRM